MIDTPLYIGILAFVGAAAPVAPMLFVLWDEWRHPGNPLVTPKYR